MKIINIAAATKEDQVCFETLYPKHNVIGFLEYKNEKGLFRSRVILKMKRGYKGWTPYDTIRDCGDHYIFAKYDRYDRIDKKTFNIMEDVEDQ